ncbi:MAG: hypothetical protein OEW87_14875, partial [Flavobacteriaceae bacterium]|nr:hypothetical protein [Flavobacteriaceae bacterium]
PGRYVQYMSIFATIDKKLNVLAAKLTAQLSKDRPEYPELLRTFEERRIDWTNNGIKKAIIIQPTFEIDGVNSEKWNFVIVAWFDNLNSGTRYKWINRLVDKDDFRRIEMNIDKLLFKSEQILQNITESDLAQV